MAGDAGQLAEDGRAIGEQAGQDGQAVAAAAGPQAQARETLTTFRNNPAVVIDGHTYVHRRTVNRVTYWRCAKSNQGCKASGTSDDSSLEMVVKNGDHNHDPDPAKKLAVQVRKLATERKQTGVAAIVDELMRGLDDDTALAVDRNNLLRVAHRAKRLDGSKQLNLPLPEIVFPDAFTKTATGLRFLIYDSRHHEIGLEQLRLRDHWSADGTFWCTPRLFDSLYTVHANVGSSSVPAAYMLLEDRHEDTYKRALRALIRYGNLQGVAPNTFMHDFELAAVKAIKAVFPNSLIRLCLFHFAQALWRNIQELGLTPLYKTVKKARILLRCFGALATVPVEDIQQALDGIVHELNGLRETGEIPAIYDDALDFCFLEYSQKTYVNRLDAQGNLAEPRYRPMLWNCFLAILQELHRTNNAVEGWHQEFNNTLTSAHPPLDKFICQLQTDEDKNRQRLIRHEAFPANPLRRRRDPACVASDRHILELARKYRTEYAPAGQALRYLKCMQHHQVQADFDAPQAEGDGQHPPAPAADDDDDDVADEDIPLNEAHPALGDASDDDDEPGNQQQADIAILPQAQRVVEQQSFSRAAHPRVQAQAEQAAQPAVRADDDGQLPGGSQLAPNVTGVPIAWRRQSKRVAASQGGPSTSSARYSPWP